MKTRFFLLILALVLALSVTALAEEQVTVTVYDSDGLTVLNEVKVDKGTALTEADLGVAKEGYQLSGVFVTPALLRPYDGSPVNQDTSLFTAWKSAKEDTRPWMLAGGLVNYPENAWGKIWPQDDFLLQPVEGEFNTFAIELSLHKDDQFKIAVIGEGYAWSDTDSLDSRNVVKSEYLTGGDDAFDTGANIKVLEDGMYRITLVTDAETIALCRISAERIGDAIEAEYKFDLQIHASFLGWDAANNVVLQQNGSDYMWYGEFDCADEEGEFGVKNYGTENWFAAEDGNIKVGPGHYMIYVYLTPDNNLAQPIMVGTPAYYVVGTCGNKGWGADTVETNADYRMLANEDGTYSFEGTFTEADTDSWTDGKVAFKVTYGFGGVVANENWFGDAGENFMVDPGTYVITFDPATKTVTVDPVK